ncbi:MAG TPA: UpxY family transcription antiterminator [Terriglobia bacterium]|nr:UpxY family transcription antiterminator [Terriglobia bacterium]
MPFAVSAEEANSDAAWYALYTRHQHEKTVASLLLGKGIQVFLPLYSAVHKWKDRDKKLLLPLYPGYVFLRDRLDRKLQILMTPGVHSIVGTAGGPEPIPEFEIAAVKRVIESSWAVEPHPFLRCGDWARVTHGPLEGIEGFLLRKKNAYRLVLSVEMLMKSVAVEIDASMVERIRGRSWNPIDRECERPLYSAY